MPLRRWVVACLVFAVAALSVGCGGADEAKPVKVGVLVITMFDPETEPWLQRESLPITVNLPTAYKPVHCNAEGLCVAQTGQGKTNAASTMMALLDSPQLDFDDAYFLTVGTAGTPPDQGTLGGAAWARWVVDFDLGNHLVPAEAPELPYGYRPVENYDTAAFQLNESLVETAFRLTEHAPLADSPEAAAERAQFPGQEGRKPAVVKCDTMTGDDWYSGKQLSETARYIMGVRTEGRGVYCTTQMEDNATAAVLQRHGKLDRYLSLRTVSNFDQPYPGQSVMDHIQQHSAGFRLSLDNGYTLGRLVVDHLLRNPPQRTR
ncbi:purine-nucleoside phosphorylase [Nocardia brasiliensis]|uniref:Purine nucleoside permease n=1 Tax=Nocardia brasiliensis (strain ATCC 700358 / HUJEG-1) TaxID=1133849 RepID=K0F5F3_NOCB7|nr:purine nucleoside permease [Nocardia brasiliensis]AFU04560.1 purine nucleoside permease [Nocardia brasiliensis ATCC 700358]OCF85784.1 purine nucleoside permease [Nocardia brasiliensis]